jgi:hypothetical protein
MRTLIVLTALGFSLILCSVAPGAEVLKEYSWDELQVQVQMSRGRQSEPGPRIVTVLPAGQGAPFEQLKIEFRPGSIYSFPLMYESSIPLMTRKRFALVGQVRCENVSMKPAAPYLQIVSAEPNGQGGASLDRDLEPGTGWQRFILLVDWHNDAVQPQMVSLFLYTNGPGTFYFGPLKLVEYDDDEDPRTVATAWWSSSQGGTIGGLLGAFIGILGGALGTLASYGKVRRFVLAAMLGAVGLGAALIAAGVVAVVQTQPYTVYFPLLLIGAISAAVFGLQLPTVRRRYDEVEMRKIQALDAS